MNKNFSHFALVIVPGGLPNPLTYGIPATILSAIQKGTLVQIPIQNRYSLGLVWDISTTCEGTYTIKPLALPPHPYHFTKEYCATLQWVANAYLCSLNQALDVFWPSQLAKYLPYLPKPLQEFKPGVIQSTPQLTVEQSNAIQQIDYDHKSSNYQAFLLHGITGSGKSLVYLQLIQQARKHNKQVLILIPEIALASQTHANFQNYLTEEVVVHHSALSAAAKRRSWLLSLHNKAHIILGTRSALLLPNLHPGLIIVDEEHDASYKQNDPAPRYHSRDLALHLALKNQATIVFGSATPSIELRYHAEVGNVTYLQMTTRATQAPLPDICLIDLKKESEQNTIISQPLIHAIEQVLHNNKQVILLHNRRGYAASRICKSCGNTLYCPDCQIPLIYHKHKNILLCHYCSRCFAPNIACSYCGATQFTYKGDAIEKVEELLQSLFPTTNIARIDRDSTQKQGSIPKLLDEFRAHKTNILLGTQMVAKGHDFPDVQLVGVISADTGMHIPDFRAAERSFQMITQVSGRAGRHTQGAKVFLQTWNPNNQVLRFALNHDYHSYYLWEKAQRELLKYPPFARLLAIECTHSNAQSVAKAAETLSQFITRQLPAASENHHKTELLGPVEAYIARVKKLHRVKLLLKGTDAHFLRTIVLSALQSLDKATMKGVKIKVDYDPADLL